MGNEINDPYLNDIINKNTNQVIFENNILNKQNKDKSETQFRKIVLYFCGFFIVISITLGFLYANTFFQIRLDNANVGNKKATKFSDDKNAYFSPKEANLNAFNLSGKIDYAYDVVNNDSVKYKLIDDNADTIVYLVSSTNDLSILVGLNANLKAKTTKTKINNKEVVDVESIQLK